MYLLQGPHDSDFYLITSFRSEQCRQEDIKLNMILNHLGTKIGHVIISFEALVCLTDVPDL